jgi:serine/threonine protein kinase
MAESSKQLGKYHILEEIGRGGFGIVYRARDTSLGNRIVALKVLHPQLVVDPASVHLFSKEAGTAASIEHPHIVTIYETDTHEQRRYIAMRYLPGPSLAQVLREQGQQSLEKVIAWIEQAASALDYAHREGVIHRDLKPSNLLLDANGQVIVTDFGLARAAEASGGISSSQDTGIMTGTARYMAPEQARWGKATWASDVYSLGIVTYELLAGRVPFDEGDAFAIAYQHIHELPPSLRDLRPDLAEEVDLVVLRALAKDPAGRYSSAGEFAQTLRLAATESEANRQKQEERASLLSLLLAHDEAGDWGSAVVTAELLESKHPGYRDVRQRLDQARERLREQEAAEAQKRAEEQRQQQLAGWYDALKSAEAAGNWAAAIQEATRIAEEAPDYHDIANRLAHARTMRQQQIDLEKQRLAEQEREKELAILYNTLLEEEKAEDWPAVISLARRIVREAPDYRDVRRRQAHAEKQRKQVQAVRPEPEESRAAGPRARPALPLRRRRAAGFVLSIVAGIGLLALWLAPKFLPGSPTPTPLPTRTPWPTFTEVAAAGTPQGTPAAYRTQVAVRETSAAMTGEAVSLTSTAARAASATAAVMETFTSTPTSTATPTPTTTPLPSATRKPPGAATKTTPANTPTATVAPPPPPSSNLTGRIAFSVFEPGSGIHILYSISPDGTDLRWLGNYLRQPSYRHDGELIVANGQGGGLDDIWRVNPDGSGTTGSAGHLDDEHPIWLQGKKAYHVACDSLRWGDGKWRIYLGDAPISYGSGGILGRFPVGLPGELVVYQGCNYGFGNGSQCGLYKVSMWGGIPTRILDDSSAIPTGGGDPGVLFMLEADANWDVYLIGAGGGQPVRLTEHSARDGLATFSPDGKVVAFLSDRSGRWAIWVMNRDGSSQRKIYDLPGGGGYADWTAERISWGPVPASPLPAPTAAGAELLAPPTFIWPRVDDVIEADKPYNIQWSWDGPPLTEDQGFEVRLRTALTAAPAALAAPTRETTLGVTFQYSPVFRGPAIYYLDIVVLQITTREVLSRPAGPIRIKLEE